MKNKLQLSIPLFLPVSFTLIEMRLQSISVYKQCILRVTKRKRLLSDGTVVEVIKCIDKKL